jgi:NAD(P)-dependent dehydrogenase (short-subunit alcohol dehydrogenase family)
MRLTGKVAIITGASRGIGRATAFLLADAGASVVLAARSADEIAAAAREIEARPGDTPRRALAVPCDVTDEEQVANLVAQTLAAFGRIDVLVNNAGYSRQMRIADLSRDEFVRAFTVNTVGPYLCSRAVLPTMKQQHSGKIINIVSGAGKRGSARRGAYSTSKFGLMGFSQSLQHEVKDDGITVCCVCPGPVDTLIWSANNPGTDPAKLLPPEEIAEVIVFAATRGPMTIIPEIEVRPVAYFT